MNPLMGDALAALAPVVAVLEELEVAYEDLILAKLEWFRLGGEVSQRQWDDVKGMLSIQGKSLDRPYLSQWAPRIGIADLLEKVCEEVGA